MIVDKTSTLKFLDFVDTKIGMVEPTCKKLQPWKQAGRTVKYIRMDSTGENKELKKPADSADWKLGMEYKYTAHEMPQHNHLVELAIILITSKGRACMVAAHVPLDMYFILAPKAFQ